MNRFNVQPWQRHPWEAGPVIGGDNGEEEGVFVPFFLQGKLLGECQWASAAGIDQACLVGQQAWPAWGLLGSQQRLEMLEACLQRFEEEQSALVGVWSEAMGVQPESKAALEQELGIALSWLRQVLPLMAADLKTYRKLPGVTGESNRLRWRGRGLWLLWCDEQMSLAGVLQVVFLSLLAGNTVLLVSALASSFSLSRLVEMLIGVGLLDGVVQYLPIASPFASSILKAPEVVGVICRQGFELTRALNAELASRVGALTPLVPVPTLVDDPEWASRCLLARFLTEQTVSANLTAIGGNTALLAQNDD